MPHPENADPTPVELDWYEQWAIDHRRLLTIAREADVSLRDVIQAIRKVGLWLREHAFYSAEVIRDRQSALLEELASRCLEQWKPGDAMAPIEQARKLLADLRDLWGADKPPALPPNDDLVIRVDGLDRIQALRRQAAVLEQAADVLESDGAAGDSNMDQARNDDEPRHPDSEVSSKVLARRH